MNWKLEVKGLSAAVRVMENEKNSGFDVGRW